MEKGLLWEMVTLEQIASMFTLGTPTTEQIREIVKALPQDQQAVYARVHAPSFFPFDADQDTFGFNDQNRSLKTLKEKGTDLS